MGKNKALFLFPNAPISMHPLNDDGDENAKPSKKNKKSKHSKKKKLKKGEG